MNCTTVHPDLFTQTETKLIKRAISLLDKKLFSKTGPSITSPGIAMDYVKLKISRKDREVFAALFLNTQNEVISFEVLFYGSASCVEINERVLISKCLHHHATGVILAHNHPSGTCKPSHEDHQLTKRLQQVLNDFEINLLDHLIVGNGTTCSFAEEGFI